MKTNEKNIFTFVTETIERRLIMSKVKIGVIGCGMISEVYMNNITKRFGNMELTACADLVDAAAEKRAEQFGIRACTVEELLADPEIEIVLNLTIPQAHAEVSRQALEAGKNVYSEKPLAVDFEEGEELISYAQSHKLLIGSAPDTFLGDGLQQVRKLLDEGKIGRPFAAQAFMMSRGPEHFHPNPAFFYQKGAGPLLDWGPYYLTALVALFGPVVKVTGAGKNPIPERKVLSEKSEKYGQTFHVEVPTYITSILEFANGMLVTLTLTFDLQNRYPEAHLPYIQIYGTEGVLNVPDVNQFAGPIQIRKDGKEEQEIPVEGAFVENCRGMGLADMAHALRTGENFRTEGNLGLHVTEIMQGILKSMDTGESYRMKSTCEQPRLLPEGMPREMYRN